ncbi:hypothetical protein [Snodgrassella communis]|uniref:Uncharacterized protein n=1 Tax=Snodgrassella alvi TaxID=1196083 RepID=A0A2N9XS37_9NEIS|nr:hypothetical protein [Snodgrassella communis]PIT51443.1 hypothetical protein BHC48_03915 [Snodgrassella communis]
MGLKFSLRYFYIERCGYFNSSRINKLKYENITATLNNIKKYIQNKSIEETGIANNNNKQPPTTFILDINHNNDFWLFTLWNVTDKGAANEMISLNPKSKIGNLESEEITAGEGKKFGFVSYFLINPEHRFYATLLPESAEYAGRKEFDQYIKNFLYIDPDFVSKGRTQISEDKTEIQMECQQYTLPNNIQGNISPHFFSHLLKSPSEVDYVIRNYIKITKIINQFYTKINTESENKKQYINTSYLVKKMFGNPKLFTPTEYINIKSIIDATFSNEADLRDWIEEWKSFSESEDDCGFKLKGDSKIYWLRGNIITTKLDINSIKKVKGIYPSLELLESVSQYKHQIIADFRNANVDQSSI